MNRYDTLKLQSVYLTTGQLHISKSPTLVQTVLGSCVAVTMFHPVLKVGAICHALLPECTDRELCGSKCVHGFKFIDCAITCMAGQFNKYGSKHDDIEIKLFGGADMLQLKHNNSTAIAVGKQNIRTALQTIKTEGLRLLLSDVGGTQGRKILFNTYTGEVMLKRLTG